MDTKVKGANCTNRQSLAQVEKVKKLPPGALWKLPEVDPNIFYLWEYFAEVFAGRELSFQELAAWTSLTGKKLNPQEVEILRQLSYAVLEQRAAKVP